VVAAITSNLALAEAPGNVRVSKADTRLSKPSVVNASQILTIDRALLTARVSALPGQPMHQVEEGLKLVLGL
jgi:mRNA interferase MazF